MTAHPNASPATQTTVDAIPSKRVPPMTEHPPPLEAVTHKVIVEVTYERGVVYLDRCGQTMNLLVDALGPLFYGNVPSMEHAELVSYGENLVVRYGREKFVVVQDGCKTLARVEQISKEAWAIVSKALDTSRQVVRAGFRVMFMWPTESMERAESLLVESGLVRPTTAWEAVNGQAKWGRSTGTVDLGDVYVTATVHTQSHIITGLLHPDQKRFIPENACVLDLDYFFPPNRAPGKKGAVVSLGSGQLGDFVRNSWTDAKARRDRMSQLLGATNGRP